MNRSAGADVESLVPLEKQRNRALHLPHRDDLAVDLEHAGAAPSDPTHVVEGESGHAKAVVLEVVLQRVLAGRKGLRTSPAQALQVEQVPGEDGLALQQIEAPAAAIIVSSFRV